MTRAVEMYYSVQEIGLLIRLCEKVVIEKLKAREFGEEVVNLGSEQRPVYRVPASGLNGYLARRRVFLEIGFAARSTGELKRKVREHATDLVNGS